MAELYPDRNRNPKTLSVSFRSIETRTGARDVREQGCGGGVSVVRRQAAVDGRGLESRPRKTTQRVVMHGT